MLFSTGNELISVLVNTAILSFSTFSIIDSSVLIAMNKPYHTWIFRKLRVYTKNHSPVVFSLHTRATILFVPDT